jgi:hypothetical protein
MKKKFIMFALLGALSFGNAPHAEASIGEYAASAYHYVGGKLANARDSMKSVAEKAGETMHNVVESGKDAIGILADHAKADFKSAKNRLISTGSSALKQGKKLASEVMKEQNKLLHEVVDAASAEGHKLHDALVNRALKVVSKAEVALKSLDVAHKSLNTAHGIDDTHAGD